MGKRYVTQTESGYHLTGSRVSLDSIVYDWLSGLSPESIVENFEMLSLEQVYGAVTYYLAIKVTLTLICGETVKSSTAYLSNHVPRTRSCTAT